jgi:tetratricopeptide (TPR) repeat protein
MNVKVYQKDKIMQTLSHGGYNPNPVFPQWNAMDIYPNQYWGSTIREPVKRPYNMLYLENEYLKVSCNVDLGGRVWSIYDKLAKRHAINIASGVYSYAGGFGKNYTCGGMEVNYPYAHSPTTRLPREYKTAKHADGSASIIIGEYERKWRTRWSITYTLRPGKAYLEMKVRLYNRTPLDSRYMYWSNCGIPVNDDTEFIFPEPSGALHGDEKVTFSWPTWRGKNLGLWKNAPEPIGLYMLESNEPYFGYYDHSADYGLAHYADLTDMPGKKYWSWGSSYLGRHLIAASHHPDGKAYGEIQAGRVVIQEHLDRVPPETEQEWTEYWYPVRDTGRINGAGRDAVISANLKQAGRKSNVEVNVQGTGTFPDAKLVVTCGDKPVVQRKISLSPETTTTRKLTLNYRPGKDEDLRVSVVNDDGEILGWARISAPSARDCWTEIAPDPVDLKPSSAEEVFQEAECLARDWFFRDERKKYQESLALDPGLSAAHIELGKLDISSVQYDVAIDHLRKALIRSEGSLEAHYFLGVALDLAGKDEQAEKAYQLAARYDYEARSRVRLAQLKMRQSDFHGAIGHLGRVKKIAGRLTRPQGLLAACLRQLGSTKEAAEVIKSAHAVDMMDPFLQIEEMLVLNDFSGLKVLLQQVNNYEPPILEAAFDYGNAGLFKDALHALKVISRPGPLNVFYKAWLEEQLGRHQAALKTALRACELDPQTHNAWRLEMAAVLEWACELLPDNPRPYYHLGNLMMARNRTEDALDLWRKAQNLGEKSYLLYASQGYYLLNVNADVAGALGHFRKAAKLNPKNMYMISEVASALNRLGKHREAIKYLSPHKKILCQSHLVATQLLEAYVATKEYQKFDKFLAAWTNPFGAPTRPWPNRHFKQGLELIAAGKYAKAIEILLQGTSIPQNLIHYKYESGKDERAYYHIGRCYEKLGEMQKANDYWTQAVTVERSIAYEPAYWYAAWDNRYYQALAHRKLGNNNQANIILEAIEIISKTTRELPAAARRHLMDLVIRAKTGDEDQFDPIGGETVEVETRAEL